MLKIQEIQKELDDRFLPLEPSLTGFRLVQSKLSVTDLQELEARLGVKLGDSFREALLTFDFGSFTIGPIAFCNTGDYISWLYAINRPLAIWREAASA